MIRLFVVVVFLFSTASSMASEEILPKTEPTKEKKKAYAIVPYDGPVIPMKDGRADHSNVPDNELPLCVLYRGPDGVRRSFSPLEERRKQREAESFFVKAKNNFEWIWTRVARYMTQQSHP
jgi:hypothetical protein